MVGDDVTTVEQLEKAWIAERARLHFLEFIEAPPNTWPKRSSEDKALTIAEKEVEAALSELEVLKAKEHELECAVAQIPLNYPLTHPEEITSQGSDGHELVAVQEMTKEIERMNREFVQVFVRAAKEPPDPVQFADLFEKQKISLENLKQESVAMLDRIRPVENSLQLHKDRLAKLKQINEELSKSVTIVQGCT